VRSRTRACSVAGSVWNERCTFITVIVNYNSSTHVKGFLRFLSTTMPTDRMAREFGAKLKLRRTQNPGNPDRSNNLCYHYKTARAGNL
jgi:hypothetical protein